MQTEVPEMLDFGSELTRLVSRDFTPVIVRETSSINVYRWKDSRKGYCNKLEYIARTKSRISSVGIESRPGVDNRETGAGFSEGVGDFSLVQCYNRF